MNILSLSIRPVPRALLLHQCHRPSYTRPYSKETITARLSGRGRIPGKKALLNARPTTVPIGLRRKRTPLQKIEVFGKLRDQTSNAAKAERFKESRRIEKALVHKEHGNCVFAYVHIRTGQVVYSLSRVMDNHKIMSQLVFHGKKTVPASLRRDFWTPYFSLHFPSSYSGLLAYHKLRELSLQRQLAPPEYLVMTTEQTLSPRRRKLMTEEEQEEWDEKIEGTEYEDGLPRLKPRAERAKSLMMQRKTSVADAAFVIDLLEKEKLLLDPSAAGEMVKTRQEEKLKQAGKRRRKKLRASWREDELRAQRTQELREKVQTGTKWGLEQHAAKRIALEHGGVIRSPHYARARISLPDAGLAQPDHATTTTTAITSDTTTSGSNPPLEVRVFWADLRDAVYAAQWPALVSHGEIARGPIGRLHFADNSPQAVRAGPDVMRVHVFMKRKVFPTLAGRVGVEESLQAQQQRREEGGSGDGGNDGARGESGEEQIAELEREGIVVERPLPSTASAVGGLWGRIKGRLGLGS